MYAITLHGWDSRLVAQFIDIQHFALLSKINYRPAPIHSPSGNWIQVRAEFEIYHTHRTDYSEKIITFAKFY